MDYFKRARAKAIDIRGVKCPCCNPYRRKTGKRKRRGLSQVARMTLKAELRHEIKACSS